jgi:hypothetical protein
MILTRDQVRGVEVEALTQAAQTRGGASGLVERVIRFRF